MRGDGLGQAHQPGPCERHRVVLIDYASHSRELARRPWTDWLRTYAAHGHAGEVLEDPGSCDITVEVPVDQLATVAEPDHDRDQATFLRAHGIDDLVAEGRAVWTERAAAPDVAALTMRSRTNESEALCDPGGLGGFWVGEWAHP